MLVFFLEKAFSGVRKVEISATCKKKIQSLTISRNPSNLMDVLQIEKTSQKLAKKAPSSFLFFWGGGVQTQGSALSNLFFCFSLKMSESFENKKRKGNDYLILFFNDVLKVFLQFNYFYYFFLTSLFSKKKKVGFRLHNFLLFN